MKNAINFVRFNNFPCKITAKSITMAWAINELVRRLHLLCVQISNGDRYFWWKTILRIQNIHKRISFFQHSMNTDDRTNESRMELNANFTYLQSNTHPIVLENLHQMCRVYYMYSTWTNSILFSITNFFRRVLFYSFWRYRK